MKQILPTLAFATLTATAFADAGAAAPAAVGLSYNRVGVTYVTNGTVHPYGLQASAFVGSSNVLVSANATLDAKGDDNLYIAYVFKNLIASTDVLIAAATNDTYAINLRRALGEVLSGLEVSFGYQSSTGSEKKDGFLYEISYNINKQYTIGYSILDPQSNFSSINSVAIRYNF